MAKLRSETRFEETGDVLAEPTPYKTGVNRYELRCGMCGAGSYVDADTFDRVGRAIREGSDNPFLCVDCEEKDGGRGYVGRNA